MTRPLVTRPLVARVLVARALAVGVLLAGLLGAAPAPGPPPWAPEAGAGVAPGVRTTTAGTVCTAGFVLYDAAGAVYVAQSAGCGRTGAEAPGETGCTTPVRPLGTVTTFADSRVPGTLAYSSWLTMQGRREADALACAYNDLALVRVPDWALNQVNPSMPLFGGPVGLNTAGIAPGEPVVGYGNAAERRAVEDLKPRQGVGGVELGGGWAHLVHAVTPGLPGDRGGPYLDAAGRAVGILSGLGPPGDTVADLGRAVAYAQRYSGIRGLRLASGTAPFEGATIASPLANQFLPPAR